ncbi:MAG: hypothetical protein AAB439_02700 [Patescibacteria group bacterium]
MFSYIDKLRKAPIEKRREAAVTFTLVLVAIILVLSFFIGWIRSFILEQAVGDTPETVQGIVAPY